MPTTEAGILTRGLSQVYVSVGEVQPDGSLGMRLYYKPLVLLIWLGAVIMASGGGFPYGPAHEHGRSPTRSRRLPAAALPADDPHAALFLIALFLSLLGGHGLCSRTKC